MLSIKAYSNVLSHRDWRADTAKATPPALKKSSSNDASNAVIHQNTLLNVRMTETLLKHKNATTEYYPQRILQSFWAGMRHLDDAFY